MFSCPQALTHEMIFVTYIPCFLNLVVTCGAILVFPNLVTYTFRVFPNLVLFVENLQ
jgi:hypothetical protein